jgi:hypothetical protein
LLYFFNKALDIHYEIKAVSSSSAREKWKTANRLLKKNPKFPDSAKIKLPQQPFLPIPSNLQQQLQN